MKNQLPVIYCLTVLIAIAILSYFIFGYLKHESEQTVQAIDRDYLLVVDVGAVGDVLYRITSFQDCMDKNLIKGESCLTVEDREYLKERLDTVIKNPKRIPKP